MEHVNYSYLILRWFSLVLFFVSLFFLVALLFRYKRSMMGPKLKLQLLAGVGVLPLMSLFFSDQTLLEGMKDDRFCGSCHTMVPFFKSIRDPEIKTLSAVHTQNHWIREKHCYTCHTDYAILGGVKAKLRGLRHMYVFYAGQGDRRPKLYKPYPNDNCLACHGGATKYEEETTHKEISAEIAKNEASCLDCHGPSHPK